MPLENPDSAPTSLLSRVRKAMTGVETGAPVIGRYAKTAPAGPGVYRMIDGVGRGALCRQGPASEEARAELCAGRRSQQPHRADDRRHGEHGIRHHRDRDRGAAARGESDQAAEAALQRGAQGRQVLPLHPHRPRPPRAADPEASRRAEPQGRLFRTRSRRPARSAAPSTRCSAPSCCAPARTPITRRRMRPCLLFQIKRCSRAVHRRDLGRGLRRAGRRGARLPHRRERRGEAQAACLDGRSEPQAGLRARRELPRPADRAQPHPVAPGHQPADGKGGRRVRRASRGGADLHPGVLLPQRQQLGQPRLFPARRQEPLGGGGAGIVHRAVLRRQAAAEAHSALA